MTAQPKAINVHDYLLLDERSREKYEYFEGVVVAQAGASATHNLILGNIIAYLHPQLRQRGCVLYPSDMRVQAHARRAYTYPDISIVCGTPLFTDERETTLTNPITIIEILSPSTEAYDRDQKFMYYRTIPSLQEYIIVAQNQIYVQKYSRQTNHFWYVHLVDAMTDRLELDVANCMLPLAAIYDGISLPHQQEE